MKIGVVEALCVMIVLLVLCYPYNYLAKKREDRMPDLTRIILTVYDINQYITCLPGDIVIWSRPGQFDKYYICKKRNEITELTINTVKDLEARYNMNITGYPRYL